MTAKSKFISVSGRLVHYLSWGRAQARGVVIWHGVFGSCHDHDRLAAHLAEAGYFVVCPDAPGCGLSDWPTNAAQTSLTDYASIAASLIETLGLESIAWIGSSKGGGVGILMAARPAVTHLLLNDVGPVLAPQFREALARRMAAPPVFANLPLLEGYLRKTLGAGGLVLDDEAWSGLAVQWSRRRDDGDFTMHYSPMLARQFTDHPEDFDLWPHWERITAKSLLLRGVDSAVGEAEAERMRAGCTVVDRPGGHVSFLDSAGELDLVLEFLRS